MKGPPLSVKLAVLGVLLVLLVNECGAFCPQIFSVPLDTTSLQGHWYEIRMSAFIHDDPSEKLKNTSCRSVDISFFNKTQDGSFCKFHCCKNSRD